MWKVAYLGYSETMLKCLQEDKRYDVRCVIAKKGRTSGEYQRIVDSGDYRYIEITTKDELVDEMDSFEGIDVIIMYKFEFIIPKAIIDKNCIVNFHGGNLRTNRGAHAVVWSVLLREAETCFSCYELTGGIDEGILIAEYHVEIEQDDNVAIVNMKLAEGIPDLLGELNEFLLGNKAGELVKGGKYRRKIVKTDYTIDLRKDSIDTICGKILSQEGYDGAIVLIDGREYRVICHDKIVTESEVFYREIAIDGNFIRIFEGAEGIEIQLKDTDTHYDNKGNQNTDW